MLMVMIKCTNAIVSWNFKTEGCSAEHNLDENNWNDTPLTILDWTLPYCWTNAVLPSAEDDVRMICDDHCGLTGPIKILISTTLTIKSLTTVISAPIKYFSLQISNNGTIQILQSFLATTNPSSWLSLQIFPYSQLLLHENSSLDAGIFNGGSILAPSKRVTLQAFYLEMCGNENASMLNLDFVSFMGEKNGADVMLSRSELLNEVTNTAFETKVAAVTNPLYFNNVGACESLTSAWLKSSVPGIFFSGKSASLVNSTVSVLSTTYFPSAMMIFSDSLQILFGQNCILKSFALIVFQNGPNARDPLSITCRLQSFDKLHIARALRLQKEADLFGISKPCLIELVDVFLTRTPATTNALVVVQNSLNISGCVSTLWSLKSDFDPKFALIVVNQSLPKIMSLSIANLVVTRSQKTNKGALADFLFYSCAETTVLGVMRFYPNTVLTWSCSTTLAAGASLVFLGQLLQFVDAGNSLVLLDPTNNFNVTIASSQQSNISFDGNHLQVEFNAFVSNKGRITIGTLDEEQSQIVSFKSLLLQSTLSSMKLKHYAVVKGSDLVINGSLHIDGALIAQKMLQLGEKSTVSGSGSIWIDTNGCLVLMNDSVTLQPSLSAMQNATIPDVLQTGGTLCCNSCNLGTPKTKNSKLVSLKNIHLLNMDKLSKSITLIAPNLSLQNINLIEGTLTADSLIIICTGKSNISALNFKKELRIETGSFVEVHGSLFVNISSLLNISGGFRGKFVNVEGRMIIGMYSKTFIRELELLSSANIIISGNMITSVFSSGCDGIGCKMFGNGTFACLNHFEIKTFTKMIIELSHVTLVGSMLQDIQSEISISNTLLDCNVVNATFLGNLFAVNAIICLSESSNMVLMNSFMSFVASDLRINGSFLIYNSVLNLDSESGMVLYEHSSTLIDNSKLLSKYINISGSNNTCKKSTLISEVSILNNMSVSECYVMGDLLVERGIVLTILQNADWGINVSGSLQLFGHILVLLDTSNIIGYSMCIWANVEHSDTNKSIQIDGIPKENVILELKNHCMQLTHKGCPPGKHLSSSGLCVFCDPGYYSSQFNSQCMMCPTGMHATSSGTECDFCPAGSFSDGNASSAQCSPCPKGMICNATGLSEPSRICPAGTYNSVLGAKSDDACMLCPIGQYQDMIGQQSCLPCSPGTFSDTNGTITCELCKAGRYCVLGCARRDGDGLCPVGSYSTLGSGKSSSCNFCPEGTYNAVVGSTTANACLKCPAGVFCLIGSNSSFGSGFCAAGTYSAEGTGSNASCSPCPVDRHCMTGCESDFGSTLCEKCKAGHYFEFRQKKCQMCEPGTFNNRTEKMIACDVCKIGSIAKHPGSTSCVQCPSGHTSNVDRNLCVPCYTQDSKALFSGNETVCLPCTLPNFVFNNSCINPFKPAKHFFSRNVSLYFPKPNASFFDANFVTR